MVKAAGISFYLQDKIYNFAQNELDLKPGDVVIVDTEIGQEMGRVVLANFELDENRLEKPLKSILRKAGSLDLEKMKKYEKKKEEARDFCKAGIKKYDLPMKLLDINFAFDGSRITFYFTSETRVDFRELVKDLNRHFQKSIRLQQIGSRDVTKAFGGNGICGRELCCSSFLKKFEGITLDMAKDQQLAGRGSERISGVCGRLRCCLAYEEDLYFELNKKMPAIGAEVKMRRGKGRVLSKNILAQTVDVALDKETRVTVPVSEARW